MLVLSRRPNERIVFQNLGISVEILRVSGKAVRVGVDAPSDVKILRGELEENSAPDSKGRERSRIRHEFRNRLNTASLALHLLSKQLEAGRLADADESLEQAVQALADLDRLAESGQPSTREAERCRTALIVEDDANERTLFAGLLRMSGYEVESVENGAEALRYLDSNDPPDVVLLDMMMPRMDGRQTVRAIREAGGFQDLKVFAVSGMDQRRSGIPLGVEGVDRWFQKPIEPSRFAAELNAELSA